MRYYYYGTDAQNQRKGRVEAANRREEGGYGARKSRGRGEEDLVVEEDTIYEIDRECEACRKKYYREE